MARFHFPVVLLLLLTSFSFIAQADEVANSPVDKKILKVGFGIIDYPPYNYVINDEYQGIVIDIFHYIEDNSDYTFEFIKLPWPRVLQSVETGRLDIVATLFKVKMREERFYFVEPAYGTEINQLFTLTDTDVEFDGDLTQLKALSIGTIRDYSYGDVFDQATFLNKRPVIDEHTLIRLLKGGRFEMAIGNPTAFYKVASELNLKKHIKAISPIVSKTPVHLAITKQRKDAAQINNTLNELIVKLKASAHYQQLLDKYDL